MLITTIGEIGIVILSDVEVDTGQHIILANCLLLQQSKAITIGIIHNKEPSLDIHPIKSDNQIHYKMSTSMRLSDNDDSNPDKNNLDVDVSSIAYKIKVTLATAYKKMSSTVSTLSLSGYKELVEINLHDIVCRPEIPFMLGMFWLVLSSLSILILQSLILCQSFPSEKVMPKNQVG